MFLGVLVAMWIRPRRPMLIATLAVFPYAVPVLLLGTDVPLALLSPQVRRLPAGTAGPATTPKGHEPTPTTGPL